MKILKSLVVPALLLSVFVSCDPEDDTIKQPPVTPPDKAELAFHFNHAFGSHEFELNKDFMLSSGYTVNLSFVKFYLSGISLMDDAGNPTPLDSYLLIDEKSHHVEVADFDPQHVHMVRFNVGVDSAANHLDPSTYPNEHALALQVPAMHWSWANGYIFFKLEGQVDTTSDGVMDATFEFHVGLDQFLRSVSGMVHKDVEAGEELMVNIDIDYAKFFDGIDLSFEQSAHGMDDVNLTKRLADNVPKAFSIQ